MKKRILVSGGWGYRNLGDDAILISTIKILKRDYPNSDIVITSYNPIDSLKCVKKSILSEVEIIPSIQRIIFGYTLQYIFNTPIVWNTFFKIKYHLWNIFHKNKVEFYYYLIEKHPRILRGILLLFYKKIEKQFKDVDLFIMSGGGYLNESHECNIGHFLEIEWAKKKGIPIYLIGQTIGPFENQRTKILMQRYLPLTNKIIVRDIDSLKELEHLGIKVDEHITPDLAIYDTSIYKGVRSYITIIPFFGIQNRINEIIEVIEELVKTTGKKVLITISQQWTIPQKYAETIYKELEKRNIDATYKIPKNVMELQDLLCKSNIVLSQNLHGLIMSYRVGTKIISLNDKRKFQTFISQTFENGKCFNIESFNKEELLNYCMNIINDRIINKDRNNIIKQISLK